MDNEQPHQELVKCVVVGDTAVGKTRLICARACNSRLDLTQLMNTHIPTVWAIDQYHIHKEVLERSCEVIDGVNVSLRLWDTFGYHDKDRRFAYGRSDVVLLCFSVANPVSLKNCKIIWYPEIRKFCPNTPIILVGCKNDLRYMYRDEAFLNLFRERSPYFRANHTCSRIPELGRPLRESDILTPEQGRVIAKEIGCYYYEASAFTHYGVNEVFESVIRVALITRRQQRFWITNLRHIQHPLIQQPFCPPKPHPPKTHVLPSQFEAHFKEILDSHAFSDTVLLINNSSIFVHKIILLASWPLFSSLLNQRVEKTQQNCDSIKLGRSTSDKTIFNSIDTSSGYSTEDTHNSNASSSKENEALNLISKFKEWDPFKNFQLSSLVSSTEKKTLSETNLKRHASCLILGNLSISNNHELVKNFGNPFVEIVNLKNGLENNLVQADKKSSQPQVILSFNDLIDENSLFQSLRFLYTGLIDPFKVTFEKLLETSQLLEINELVKILKNVETNHLSFHQYFGDGYQNEYIQKLKQRLKVFCLNEELYSDVIFQLMNGKCAAHKSILIKRCEMMNAMLTGDFRESSAKIINFPDVMKETFKQFLYYIYTDEVDPSITSGNCLQILELANRFCLPRLVNLIEFKIIHELEKDQENGSYIYPTILRLLEPCQMHNADQLSDWCLYQIAISYKEISQNYSKLMRSLHPENQAYLNRNRWPSVWYLRELEYYERCIREKQLKEKPPKYLKRQSYRNGCLCFPVKIKKKTKQNLD